MTQSAKCRADFSSGLLRFLVAGVALGCGSAESFTGSVPTAEASTGVLVCNHDWTTIEERELYVISGIQKKLRDYPEFAAEIGVESVSTCDEARAFMKSYADYSERYPGFDADQPIGPIEDLPPPPSGASATLETQKLIGGTTGFFGLRHPQIPVVRISRFGIIGDTFGTIPCTGTFIAKNWIATAAHCLARIGSNPTDLKGYTDYTIQFSLENGAFTGTIESKGGSVLQLPDPRYMGDGDVIHDFALLFLDKKLFDPKLPNPGDGAAMRVLTTLADLDATTFISGTTSGELRTAELASFFRTPDSYQSTLESGQPVPCAGDSGGPLFQTPLSPGPIPVLLGTWMGWRPQVPGPETNCPATGDRLLWTRMDRGAQAGESIATFIQAQVEKWIGKCKEFQLPAGASALQCWGDPCQLDTDCPQTPVKHYCSNPHRSYPGRCPICEVPPIGGGTATPGCECIQGQCLPAPTD